MSYRRLAVRGSSGINLGRAVEFGINALMVYRLGTMTMRRLRPVRQS
jgi:hypothetical protein